MRRTRLWATTALAGLTVGLLGACSAGADPQGTSSGSSSVSAKDSAAIALNSGVPKNLDFTTTDGAAIPQALLGNVYEGLVALDDSGAIVPALAKSWTTSSDNKTYTFELQPGVKFSNGADFTADDVKFSIDRVKSDAWTISLKSGMDVVDSVKVVSPTTVEVALKSPSNGWLYSMTTRIGAMFDTEGVSDLANTPVGTGPFAVSEFVRDTSLTLARRDDYWGQKPTVKTVTFKYFDDVNSQIAALQSGGIDAISGLPDLNTLDQFKGSDKFDVVEGNSTNKWTLSMNNSAAPFNDLKVRQAINYAIDRQALLLAVANGYGKVTGSFVPPSDPWYEDLSGAYPFDPEKAKALLADAVASNLSFQFDVPNLPAAVAAAQVIKSDLANIGVTADVKTMEFPATWLDTVFTKADYQMSIIGHVESRDLPIYGNPDYYWRYDNPEVQALLKSADAGTPDQQKTDLAKVMKTLSDDAVSDWLYLAANINVVDKGLSGLPQNAISESLNVSKLAWS